MQWQSFEWIQQTENAIEREGERMDYSSTMMPIALVVCHVLLFVLYSNALCVHLYFSRHCHCCRDEMPPTILLSFDIKVNWMQFAFGSLFNFELNRWQTEKRLIEQCDVALVHAMQIVCLNLDTFVTLKMVTNIVLTKHAHQSDSPVWASSLPCLMQCWPFIASSVFGYRHRWLGIRTASTAVAQLNENHKNNWRYIADEFWIEWKVLNKRQRV